MFPLSMALDILPATACLLVAILAIRYTIIATMRPKQKLSYPPQVPGLLPWVGPFASFTFRRSEFITLCE